MFDDPTRLLLGFLTGIAFGFFLHKGGVARHEVIVGQLLLRDHTVIRVMLTAVAVGAAGFWTLAALGMTPVDVKPLQIGGVLAGAVLFGVGLAVLGYCPGTTVAAVGAAERDALAGLAGMLAGALVFVGAFDSLEDLQKSLADLGPLTIPAWTNVPAPVWIAALGAAALASVLLRQRRGVRGPA